MADRSSRPVQPTRRRRIEGIDYRGATQETDDAGMHRRVSGAVESYGEPGADASWHGTLVNLEPAKPCSVTSTNDQVT